MPFYHNHLCPCPIIDNPQALREMVEVSGAHPTHVGAETVLYGDIAAFLDERSAKWEGSCKSHLGVDKTKRKVSQLTEIYQPKPLFQGGLFVCPY